MLAEAHEVCPTTTRRLVAAGALLVDVREQNEIAALAFDVPGVIHIPLLELETSWQELPKDRDLIFVCKSGARSLKATYYMQFRGHDRVSNMSGGIVKWMQKGFPVVGRRHPAAACAVSDCGAGCPSVSSAGGCC